MNVQVDYNDARQYCVTVIIARFTVVRQGKGIAGC
ncbi:hypothetical protein GMJAKD_12410 [Candidatus Electrothrix aarhusensis]